MDSEENSSEASTSEETLPVETSTPEQETVQTSTPEQGSPEQVSPAAESPVDTSSLPEIPTDVPYLIIGGGTAAFAAFRAIRSRDAKAKVSVLNLNSCDEKGCLYSYSC